MASTKYIIKNTNFNNQTLLSGNQLPELIEFVGSCYVLTTTKSLIFNKKATNDVSQ